MTTTRTTNATTNASDDQYACANYPLFRVGRPRRQLGFVFLDDHS